MHAALYAIIGACVLVARAEGQVAAPDLGTVVVRDSSVARVIGTALFEQLAGSLTQAAFDTTTRPVTLQFPDADAPDAWRQLRAHLLLATRGRVWRPGDRVEWFATVGEARVSGDSLAVRLSIGTRRECTAGRGDWTTTEQAYLVRATRMPHGSWSGPTVVWVEEALGPSCDVIRAVSGAGGG